MKKVTIKSTPGSNIRPLYQQNKQTFALDTAPPFDLDKGKEEEEFRNQYPEAEEGEENVEVEAGERILTPELENYSVGGEKHSKGGTKVKLDPGTFIYSNDKSLKIKGDILNEFGIDPESKLGKKGYTPAEIAKKYPTNKLLHLLRSKNSDKLDQDTAALNLDGAKRKLAKLAFLQESMKGFPNGIPSIADPEQNVEAEETGIAIPKAQMGFETTGVGSTVKRKPWQGGYNWRPRDMRTGKLIRPEDWWWDAETGKWMPNANVKASYKKKTATNTVPRGAGSGNNVAPSTGGVAPGAFQFPYTKVNTGDPQMSTPGNEILYNGSGSPNIAGNNGAGSDTIPRTYSDSQYSTGYGDIDFVNMSAPFMTGLRKFDPVRINVGAENLDFNPLDLEAQRQAIKGQVRTAQDANAVFSGSASQASARNSQLFGQSLDPINQSFMTEFNANQAGRTQVEGQNAQFRQQATLANANADDQYNVRSATANESLIAEKRLRLNSFLKGLNTAERNRQIRDAGNVINQDFMITANGAIVRKASSMDPERQFQRITGMSGNSQPIMTFDQYKASLPPDVVAGTNPWQLWQEYQQQNSASYRARTANNVTVSSRNPGLVPQTPYDYSTYPQ